MSLATLFLVSGMSALAIQYLVTPALAERLLRDRSSRAIPTAGWLGAAAALRSAAIVAALTSVGLLVFFAIVDRYSAENASSVMAVILSLEAVRDRLMGFGAGWGAFMTGLILFGMVIFAYRKGKRQMNGAMDRVCQSQLETLQLQQQRGELEALEPNEDMRVVADVLEKTSGYCSNVRADSTLSVEQGIEQIAAAEADIAILNRQYDAIDILRRVKPELAAADVELPRPKNSWERIQTFFISQGLMRCCGLGSRVVYLVLMIVLIPSLLGAYSGETSALLNRRLVRLNNLRLQLAQDEADAIIDAASDAQVEQALSADDESVLEKMAALVERETTVAETFGAQSLRTVSTYTIASSLARQQVLSIAATRPNSAFSSTDELAKADWLNDAQRDILKKSKNIESRMPKTRLGENIHKSLRRVARTKPGFVERVRVDLKSFQRPVTNASIRTELVGGIVNGKGAGLSSSQRALVQATHQARATTAISEYVAGKTDFGQMLAKAGTPDKGLETAIRASEFVDLRSNFRRSFDAQVRRHENLAKNIKSRPPASVPKTSTRIGTPAATRAVESLRARQVTQLGPLAPRSGYVDVLAKYTDFFPHRAGADTLTPRGKLLSRWNPRFANPAAAKVRFQRGFSFSQLRGFTRVGGVLIGQPPQGWDDADIRSNSVDIRDIEWNWDDGRIRFVVIDSGGGRHETSSYDARIAYHALIYAADGRPIAVTILNTGLPGIRSVMLHPTLVNSKLGQQMIELDNFVYDFTQDNEQVRDARGLVDSQQMLYRIAWAARMSQLATPDQFAQEARETLVAERDRAKSIVETVLADEFPLEEVVGQALRESDALSDPKRSPLAKMDTYFDPDLVRLMAKAADESDDPREFVEFIRDEADRQWRDCAKLFQLVRQHERQMERGQVESEIVFSKMRADYSRFQAEAVKTYSWVFPPPEFDEASGVRELDYDADLADMALESKQTPEDILRFTIQLATSSHPYFDLSAEDEHIESTAEPWEFETLLELVSNSVIENVNSDAANMNVLSGATEFAALQRLFRSAFGGQLGQGFPIAKLGRLANDLANHLPESELATPSFDFSDSHHYLDLLPEIQLASRVVTALGQESLLEKLGSADSFDSLDTIASVLAVVMDQPNSEVAVHLKLLKRRFEIGHKFVSQLRDIKKNQERLSRTDFDDLWMEYSSQVKAWHAEWDGARTSPTATESLPNWVTEAYELVDLKNALGFEEDLRESLWRVR